MGQLQTSNSNILKDIQVTRKSDAEIRQLVEQLKNSSMDEISVFGSLPKNTKSVADEILDATKNVDMGEVKNTITNILKLCDGSGSRPKKNLLAKIFGAANNVIKDVKIRYSTVQEHLGKLVTELEENTVKLDASRKILERLVVKKAEDYYAAEDVLKVLLIAKQELEAEIKFTPEDTMNALLRSEGSAFAMELLNQRIDDMETDKMISFQAVPQIMREIANFKRAEIKFKSLNSTVIAQWKNDIVMYIQSLRLKQTIQITDAIQSAANKLYVENADRIAENTKDVLRVTSQSILSIESIEHVNKSIRATLENIKQIADQTVQDRKDRYLRLDKSSAELVKVFNMNEMIGIENGTTTSI